MEGFRCRVSHCVELHHHQGLLAAPGKVTLSGRLSSLTRARTNASGKRCFTPPTGGFHAQDLFYCRNADLPMACAGRRAELGATTADQRCQRPHGEHRRRHRSAHEHHHRGANTAYGNAALRTNTTGNNNTAVGAFALESNTDGTNTAVGFFTLGRNTTGSANTAFGDEALE